MDDVTIFDKMLAKEIPAKVVYEDEHVFAFHDINPQAPVHVLVIPKIKARNMTELAEHDVSQVGHYLKGVAATAKQLNLAENGYRVVFNTGNDGQQTVEYIHAHILGGRQMAWPPG
jgi:histidine triad (HIT) family protein